MGSGGSSTRAPPPPPPMQRRNTAAATDEAEAKRVNAQIERQLRKDGQLETGVLKLLLLGGSESGKSTIAKQMKILHMNGFNEAEHINYRYLIRSNVVTALIDLLNGVRKLGLPFNGNIKEKSLEFFRFVAKRQDNWDLDDEPSVCGMMRELWHCDALQTAFERRLEFQMADNAQGLLPRLDDVVSRDYKPTEADILFCRMATTGVHEIKFDFRGSSFRLIDVGGQKSERRKWIHCFEGVTAIMFVAALSCYDQHLAEDTEINRMHDAVALFHEILGNAFLLKSNAILFLNKKDLFEAKLTRSPLTVAYPDYDGAGDMADASEFIKGKFLECLTDGRTVYTHLTNATDTENVNVVFDACCDIILKQNITGVGV